VTSEGYDELYQDLVLDHYKSPRNYRLVDNANLTAEGFNPFCGDRVKLTAKVDENEQIIEVGFSGSGCAISQASASMMGEQIKGLSLMKAKDILTEFKNIMQGIATPDHEELGDLIALEGVRKFPIRIKCALLAWSALQDGITEHQKQRDLPTH
jgi:nitrogen fixation NifU-like protein